MFELPSVGYCENTADMNALGLALNGWDVVYVRDGTLASFQSNFENADTAAFLFGGHGSEAKRGEAATLRYLDLTNGWWQAIVTAAPWNIHHRPFGLSYLGLFACYSANTAQVGLRVYWSQFVSDTGKFVGGNGDVYIWSTFVSWTGPTPPSGI
jgi:hypothetical protein